MKRYRIISDGRRYRVQRRFRFGPLNYWRHDCLYEVRESYPKVLKYRVEFDTLKDAETYVSERLEADPSHGSHRPFDKPKGWHTVEKFSDNRKPEAEKSA